MKWPSIRRIIHVPSLFPSCRQKSPLLDAVSRDKAAETLLAMDSVYNYLNAQWLSFVAAWPYNEHWLITAFLTGAHAAIWIPFNVFLFVLNYWGPAAKAFETYKIRKGSLPPWRLVQQCLTEMVRNYHRFS